MIRLSLLGEYIPFRFASGPHNDADLLRFVESIERMRIGEVVIKQIFVYGR
jgi:hypothetical protein